MTGSHVGWKLSNTAGYHQDGNYEILLSWVYDTPGEQGRGIVHSNYSVISLKDKWRKLPQRDRSNVQKNDDWRVDLLPIANCHSGLTKEWGHLVSRRQTTAGKEKKVFFLSPTPYIIYSQYPGAICSFNMQLWHLQTAYYSHHHKALNSTEWKSLRLFSAAFSSSQDNDSQTLNSKYICRKRWPFSGISVKFLNWDTIFGSSEAAMWVRIGCSGY